MHFVCSSSSRETYEVLRPDGTFEGPFQLPSELRTQYYGRCAASTKAGTVLVLQQPNFYEFDPSSRQFTKLPSIPWQFFCIRVVPARCISLCFPTGFTTALAAGWPRLRQGMGRSLWSRAYNIWTSTAWKPGEKYPSLQYCKSCIDGHGTWE